VTWLGRLHVIWPGYQGGEAADDRAGGSGGPGCLLAGLAPQLPLAGLRQHLAMLKGAPSRRSARETSGFRIG
jgi:hypothetical protein